MSLFSGLARSSVLVRRAGTLIAVLALSTGVLGAVASTGAPAAAATPVPTIGRAELDYTGAPQTFAVPANVRSLTITAQGGAGGPGVNQGSTPGGPGGDAGSVTGTFSVNPGDLVFVLVGQAGVSGGNGLYGLSGGSGGPANDAGLAAGGNGGAATEVELPAGPVVIAGGGGGGGGASGDVVLEGGKGGAGGLAAAVDGGDGNPGGGDAAGSGGSGLDGGRAGAAGAPTQAASLGAGGGGGGAGYQGGQGGGASGDVHSSGGGGNGGTSWSADPDATFATASSATDGSVVFQWTLTPNQSLGISEGPATVGLPFPVSDTLSAPAAGMPAPTGTVTFRAQSASGVAVEDTVAIAGSVATGEMLANLPAGRMEITASYSGDANYAPADATPIGQAVQPFDTALFVANNDDGTVTPVDPAGEPGPAIKVGIGPVGIAFSPNAKFAYVSNQFSKTVSVINASTDKVVKTIRVGKYPGPLAVTPDGKTVFVANQGDKTVQSIDTATDKAGTPINIGDEPSALAISPDGATLYVAGYINGTIVPVTVATRALGNPIVTGYQPNAIALSPDGKHLYVANGGGTIAVVNTTTLKASTPIVMPGTVLYSLALTSDGTQLFATDVYNNEVDVFPVINGVPSFGREFVGELPVEDVAVAPGSGELAVSENDVSAIETYSTAVGNPGPTIAVGADPGAMAFAPDQAPVAAFKATAKGQTAAVTATAHAGALTGLPIASYKWSWGDGTTSTLRTAKTKHTYAAPGTYSVTLTVTDEVGTSTTVVENGQQVVQAGAATAAVTHPVAVA